MKEVQDFSDFTQNTRLLGLNILIIALLIVFSVLVPGLSIGAFVSFLIIAYARKEKLSARITLVFCLYVILLSFLVKQNIIVQPKDHLLRWLAIAQEPFFIGAFLLIFSRFSNKKLFSYGNTISLVVLFSLFQEFFIKGLVFLLEKKSIDYIHFSIPPKDYSQLVQQASANPWSNKKNADAFAQSLHLLKTYWGVLCAIINGCWFMVLARFLGKKYVLKRFFLRQMLLPKWLLSTFLAVWFFFLVDLIFDFSSITSQSPILSNSEIFQQIVGTAQKISTALLWAIASLFFWQGLAIWAHFFGKMMHNLFQLSKKNLKGIKHLHSFVPILFLLALFFFLRGNTIALLFVILATECLGILEMWFDFRKISQKKLKK